jgi:hypothetical protein
MSLLTENADELTLTGCELTSSHQPDTPFRKMPGKWLGLTGTFWEKAAGLAWQCRAAGYG